MSRPSVIDREATVAETRCVLRSEDFDPDYWMRPDVDEVVKRKRLGLYRAESDDGRAVLLPTDAVVWEEEPDVLRAEAMIMLERMDRYAE